MLVELSIPTNNLCTSLLLMKVFTNMGLSWFGTTIYVFVVKYQGQRSSFDQLMVSSTMCNSQDFSRMPLQALSDGPPVRDRGSNMKIEIKKSFNFYIPNSRLRNLYCLLLSLVNLCAHHASSYRNRKIVSKIRKIICAI